MVFSANTSPAAPTWQRIVSTNFWPSRRSLTTDPGNRSAGTPLPSA